MNPLYNFKNRTLKTQFLIIITIVFLTGIIIISWSTNYIQKRFFEEIIKEELNSLKYSTISAIYPLLITQDYDRIERFLYYLSIHKEITNIKFINKDKIIFLDIKKK